MLVMARSQAAPFPGKICRPCGGETLKKLGAILIVTWAVAFATAQEPDGLTLPPGFHASVVAEALGPIRHLAVRGNGNVYVSTPQNQQEHGSGIIALHLDANHHADQIQHFGSVEGGTGIRFHNDRLYASTPSGVYRFTFRGNELVPSSDPELIVDGMSASHPGFNRVNRPIAFDGKGSLFVALDGSANLCTEQALPPPGRPQPSSGASLVGQKPCADLGTRAGVWRFDANKVGQKFPVGGEQWSTGIRDIDSLDWSSADGHLYGIMHGRDNTHRFWPDLVSAEEEDHIADEMHRITKLTDFGWPYTYFDGARNVRLISPEYGGDGQKSPPAGSYSSPVLTFHSRRAAPVDLLFYSGSAFPRSYRGGAFIVLHGTQNRYGYDIVFVPFDRNGKAGSLTVFADGFAAFDPSSGNRGPARYRPMGVAQGPDGALYVADSQKGRIWRIAYQGEAPRPTGSR
jgi:glucose/arabinose dehydrogenase